MIFGNSGSGKSTYAKAEAARLGCPHLDLDTIAWDPDMEAPTRREQASSLALLSAFTERAEAWVVEGCYADLLTVAAADATELVFLNPGSEVCANNARSREWEPHKYPSKAAQDANLDMLLAWIHDYDVRTDVFSLGAHRQLFDGFDGPKREFRSNQR